MISLNKQILRFETQINKSVLVFHMFLAGENMENKQRQTENSESEIFVQSNLSEESRSETLTGKLPITSQMGINNKDLLRKGTCDENKSPLNLQNGVLSWSHFTLCVFRES